MRSCKPDKDKGKGKGGKGDGSFDPRKTIQLIRELGGVAKVEKLIEAVREADQKLSAFGGMEGAAMAVGFVRDLEEALSGPSRKSGDK